MLGNRPAAGQGVDREAVESLCETCCLMREGHYAERLPVLLCQFFAWTTNRLTGKSPTACHLRKVGIALPTVTASTISSTLMVDAVLLSHGAGAEVGFLGVSNLASSFKDRKERRLPNLLVLLLQHGAQKSEHLLGRSVVGDPQVIVERRVVFALGGIGAGGNVCFLQCLKQTLRLPLGFGMVGDVQDQERRNVLSFGNVRD
jgi:hypothetical protein